MKVQARFTTTTGKGIGQWRNYYDAEDLKEAKWAASHLVSKAQIRVMDGKTVVAGPMLAEEFLQ